MRNSWRAPMESCGVYFASALALGAALLAGLLSWALFANPDLFGQLEYCTRNPSLPWGVCTAIVLEVTRSLMGIPSD